MTKCNTEVMMTEIVLCIVKCYHTFMAETLLRIAKYYHTFFMGEIV